jgi:hypothetical protein
MPPDGSMRYGWLKLTARISWLHIATQQQQRPARQNLDVEVQICADEDGAGCLCTCVPVCLCACVRVYLCASSERRRGRGLSSAGLLMICVDYAGVVTLTDDSVRPCHVQNLPP